MIRDFQQKDIQVIIFTVPHSNYYLDTIPESDKENFDAMLNELASEYNLKIYDLQKKYHGLEIWRDVTHIAYNKASSIYSEDVANMILDNDI